MDKIPFENENDTEKLINELTPKEESLSEISELASTSVAIPLDSGDSSEKALKASVKKRKKEEKAPAATADTAASVPVRHWFVTLMCMNIPIIGWIYLIVLACSPSKGPRRDFAKAYLLYKLVFLILALAILSVAVYYGLEVLDKVLAYMEML